MSDDFFAELEAEIAVHVAADKLKRDREAARKKANTNSLPYEIRQAAGREFKELDKLLQAQEWEAVATVALFNEQVCDGCGSIHRTFLQYMELYQLKRKASTQRWERVSKPQPEEALRRESLIQPTTTHMCADCCEDHGFALLTADRLKPAPQPLMQSPTYIQEDINAHAA